MKKIGINILVGMGIFGVGTIFGKQIQKKEHNRKTIYAGDLNIKNGNEVELYLALRVQPEELVNASDVIFRVNKLA